MPKQLAWRNGWIVEVEVEEPFSDEQRSRKNDGEKGEG